jgi:hypothetical protein
MIPYPYFFLLFFVIIIILYYLDFNPFFFMKKDMTSEVNEISEVNVSDIEISINELKNLNQYIDNGITNHPPL